jgi:acetyl esterase/lipase
VPAPAKHYPNLEPNAALDFLQRNSLGLHADLSRLFLAGDSAGAQIAAQLSNVITRRLTQETLVSPHLNPLSD